MASGTSAVDGFVEGLLVRFPEDAEDLKQALEVCKQQRLHTVERLGKLNDSQWQRLNLPLGIEALLREEVGLATVSEIIAPAAAAVAREPSRLADTPTHVSANSRTGQRDLDDFGELPLEPVEGLRRRAGSGAGVRSRHDRPGQVVLTERQPDNSEVKTRRKPLLSEVELTPPDDLEQMWQQLLEDTLPPDKRPPLQETWQQVSKNYDKYMMFLEYSGYLRKVEVTEEEKAERRKELEPLMKEFGLQMDEEESGWLGLLIGTLLVGLVCFIAGLVYYYHAEPQVVHDLSAL